MNRDYLALANLSDLQLVIVGKDPYPKDATGVPFCKPCWDSQTAANCSGRYVLESLGIDPEDDELHKAYPTPKHIFDELCVQGVVFLNACFDLIDGPITKRDHSQMLQDAYEVNESYLAVPQKVVYCGEAKKICWINEGLVVHRAMHPDFRNKNHKDRSDRWRKWWDPGQLQRKFNLRIHLQGRDG